jgi:hypothetical protein
MATATAGLLASASLVIGASRVASASTITHTRAGDVAPATWVDDQGRHYTVGLMASTDDPPQPQWFVTRDDPNEPGGDTSWGTYSGHAGVRAVTFAPPGAGMAATWVPSATDGGVITLVWTPTSCATNACDRTFAHYGPDGTPIGEPDVASAVPRIDRALPDGSFTTRTSANLLGWRGPDGSDRGAPTTSDDTGVAVDHDGNLLVASGGAITRWPESGPAETVTSVTCNPGAPLAVGPAADDGFATACMDGDPAMLTVRRHQADGTVSWTSTGTLSTWPITEPQRVLGDEADRVWVGGGTTFRPDGFSFDLHGSAIAAFGPGGPLNGGADLPATDREGAHSYATLVSDVRPVADGRIAYAAIDECCSTIAGIDPQNDVGAGILPLAPGKPDDMAGDPTISAADDTSLDVAFAQTVDPRLGHEPSGYRVSASGCGLPLGGAHVDVPATAATPTLGAHLTGLTGGALCRVNVTPYNSFDDVDHLTWGPGFVDTVLPFTSTQAFAQRQLEDLVGEATTVTVNQLVNDIETGEAPAFATQYLLDGDAGLAHKEVEPVARLYRAYFLRDPDLGGLRYWVAKRHGGLTLSAIASQFARSSEFVRRYGTMANRAFVAKLYQNVFGRSADVGGLAFWTKRLDKHVNSRGQVVLQFSESSEGVSRSASIVQPLAVAYLMLDRLPTLAERTAWAQLPHPHHDVPAAIFTTHEYALHITEAP